MVKRYGIYLFAGLGAGALLALFYAYAVEVLHPTPKTATETAPALPGETPASEQTTRSRVRPPQPSPASSLSGTVDSPQAYDAGSNEPADAMIRRLRNENADLRAFSNDLQEQLHDLFAWMIENYKGRYPLRETQITNLHFHVLSEGYGLNPAVAEFMNLSTSEVSAINELLEYGVDALDELIQNKMIVSDSGSGRLTLQVPPFPLEGGEVRADVYFGLEATLGPSRFDRFLDVTQSKLEEDFHYFGNASHIVMIEPVYSENGQHAEWLLRDGWIIQETPTSTTIRATETVLSDLPDWYEQVKGQP